MKTIQSFLSTIKIWLLVFTSSIYSCENKQKSEREQLERLKVEQEIELKNEFSKFKDEIQSKHNAIFLDSLFAQDSSKLTYSYVIENKITKVNKPILARAIILDILKVNDSSYQIVTIIPYRKKHGYDDAGFYAQLQCSEKLVRKIESINLNSEGIPYVFLLMKINRYATIEFQFDVKDESYDDIMDYDINLEYTHAHMAKGICLDIEFEQKFERFLED